ncbi:MAG: beta-ketoacyl-[acyl-carrier-protein] synthase family protein [Caldilineaceae bacterium]|nr:beta-ketoacyl-[acyl-carrier-protein] synthase family protein [Caldilineaceae bacterium]MCY4118643.1 beta-ketoacyl-[acyl-carrier-protein] synthase family protein [Caldilineaceae bacterium]MDE0072267.1 beta-ketoacyl-[acyl-carrier-protein] synthase family protein [Caldilineaceae bacterium]MDE0183431.1 beta-ketoacyl-[acyl-carrier-protein] synthase family protein [Caldilineaceae bacterium]MDE0430639.1 beta-ketoacyl-[acyl-carrier-protein] synthase family protein [Caldilineaceae bacterium]
MKRIVITGMGAITPIGNDPCTFWQNLLIGKSGAGPLTLFDAGEMPYNIACEVKEFDARQYMDRKVIRRTARATQFAVASTVQALSDAGLEINEENRDEVGVMMATGGGGIIEIEFATEKLVEKSWKTVGPFVVPSAMANAASCVVSMAVGARGPVMTSAAACASGHYSILEAYHFLQRGEAEVMIAGGTESAISMLTFAAFGNMGPLSKDTHIPEKACRPFSIDRNGFVSGEGAVTMIMETEEHAKARGAEIYAEVLGGALTGDAYHLTAPDPSADGASRAIRKALRYSDVAAEDVDVILAHGTGTELNDEVEALAIRQVFGQPTPKTTSIKCMVGHALGAAGAESALAAVMAIRENTIPPTINYTEDPALGVDVVGNESLSYPVRLAIVNAFGFGGQNVVAVFGEYDG